MHAPQSKLSSICLAAVVGLLLTATSCSTTAAPASGHAYNGTASVGDFYTISENDTADTITYTDVTNGLTGTVPFTTADHIHYTFTDPTSNLIKAVAVPGFAMILESSKSGATSSTPALITAVESGPITLASASGTYNMMQFRTSAGGLAIAAATVTSSTLSITGYSPLGATTLNPSSTYENVSFPLTGSTESANGTYVTVPANSSTVFGTTGTGASILVDVDFGSVIGLQQATSAAFQTSNAGTYTGVAYGKTGATYNGTTETGTGVFTDVTLTITNGGVVTLTNANTSAVISTGTLIPISTASYFYNGTSSEVTNPCYGLFTYRTTVPGVSQTDFYIDFNLGGSGSAAFSMFTTPLPLSSSNPYNYLYGVAVP